MAQYLSQLGRLHHASSVVCAGVRRELPASQNTPSLFVPPLLPVWLSCLYCLPERVRICPGRKVKKAGILKQQCSFFPATAESQKPCIQLFTNTA